MNKKVYLRTFGCQMNDRDSEYIAGLFIKKGYRLVDSPGLADVIIYNTCSVRKHAEERAISNIAQIMHKHKNKRYVMVGCAAQALKDKLFDRLPRLGIVCGTGEISKLPELVHKEEKKKITALEDVDTHLPEEESDYRQDKKSCYVSIMRGCNNYCSYCIVPYVRGRERSRKPGDIIQEVKGLIERGIVNITLLGQNVNSYRSADSNLKLKIYDFADLLIDINRLDGIQSIRFATSHPKDASSRLFEAMRDMNKVVKHLHLPLQSGSDKILKLMNRDYTSTHYIDLAKKARSIISGLRLTTDVIVGFPGETKEDFNDTLRLMREIKFDQAYIFKYSPRPHTSASDMTDDVSGEEKKRRHAVLLRLQKDLFHEKEKNKPKPVGKGEAS